MASRASMKGTPAPTITERFDSTAAPSASEIRLRGPALEAGAPDAFVAWRPAFAGLTKTKVTC